MRPVDQTRVILPTRCSPTFPLGGGADLESADPEGIQSPNLCLAKLR